MNHWMSVTIDSSGHVGLDLICLNDEALLCHYVCADGCESWDHNDHVFPDRRNGAESGHRLEWRPICSAAEWFDVEGAEDHYVGDTYPLRDGMPVEVKWDGDTYVWKPIVV